MKIIILIALVASVAARGLDLDTLRLIKEKSLLNRPVVDDVLVKDSLLNRVPLEKTIVGDYPVDRTVYSGVEGFKGTYDVDRVLTFDELVNTEVFRQYLQIPLFRQYIQYPSFQRYVASTYFQRFYQIPAFRQYFLNPVLFYKYIYPIVQLFNSEYTVPTTQSIYGQRDVLNQDVLGLQGLVDDVVVRNNRNVLPYVYNNRYSGYSTYGQQYLPYTTNTNYKFLLDKIYRTLYNTPVVNGQDVTEVKTDVRVFPGEKKVVVEPITGEQKVVEQPKQVVDVEVAQNVVPVEQVQDVNTVVPVVDTVVERNVDVLLLKQLLKLNIITPEVYQYIISGKIDLPTVLLRERVITPEIYQLVVLHKVDLVTVLRQILGIELTTDVVSPVVTRRDVVDNVFDYPVNRFANTERVNYNYNQLYNNYEIPTYRRDTTFNNRFPYQYQNVVGNNVFA